MHYEFRPRSSSPDVFLPHPDQYQYSSSYHPPSYMGHHTTAAYAGGPSNSTRSSIPRPHGMRHTGMVPDPAHPVSNPHWYDGVGTRHFQQQQHYPSDMGVAYHHPGQRTPQSASLITSPRRVHDRAVAAGPAGPAIAGPKFGQGPHLFLRTVTE